MISKQEVQHIASLARLTLTEKELEKMQKELAGILDYVDVLKKADVSGVKTLEHSVGLGLSSVTREDKEEPEQDSVVEKIKNQFPDKQGDYLKVKGVL